MATVTTSKASATDVDTAAADVDYGNLIPKAQLQRLVEGWLEDDMPSHLDVGGFVVGSTPHVAKLWMKSYGVLAGKVFVNAIFESLSCQVEWHETILKEGQMYEAIIAATTTTTTTDSATITTATTATAASKNSTAAAAAAVAPNKLHVATVTGLIHQILRGERTALNILSRCSGVATASRQAVRHARALGWKGWVAGTRKTTPGFRLVEKYGLLVGGAATHRLDLSQMVMLKDNHIWSCCCMAAARAQQPQQPQNHHVANGIQDAVRTARLVAGFSQKIEVECQSLEDALHAAQAGADIVMLDNMEPTHLKEQAKRFKEQFPHVLVEASGGITMDNMAEYVSDHVDIISQGKLTQGYACLDFSLKIDKP